MIEVKLHDYDEQEIMRRIERKIIEDIIKQEKYLGNPPPEGHYSTFDRFKNQVADLVAQKLTQELFTNANFMNRTEKMFENIEKQIVAGYFKRERRTQQPTIASKEE